MRAAPFLVFSLLSSAAFGQTTSSPTCAAPRLVGTWERISLLRNALSVQPPDAPLFVKFGSDGHWSMMEMPERPKIDKPLEQLTAKELFTRFDSVDGGYGTWTIKGDVVTRRHLVNIGAGGENNSQDRSCIFENEILALIGVNSGRTPQARFRRLTPQPPKSNALVGTWERTALNIDGTPAPAPAAQIVILGEDGWFSQTQLPTGRKPAGKPLAQFTVDDYVKTYGGVAASRGTYNVENDLFMRKHVDHIDPNLVGSEEGGQFSVEGEVMTLRGSTRTGAKLDARYQRLKPLSTSTADR
jgi:hypothetical protein